MKTLGHVVEHFAVPPKAPKPVAEASAKFEEITADYQATRAEYNRLQASYRDDVAEANREAAEARVEGKTPPKATADKVAAVLHETRSRMEVLESALHLAGDRLVQAVAEHKVPWMTALEQLEAEAADRYRYALTLAREAATDLRNARSAPTWLRAFRLDMALAGNVTQYPGGRPILVDPGDRGRFMDSNTPIELILDIAQLAVDPDPEPAPITTPATGQNPLILTESGEPFEVTA